MISVFSSTKSRRRRRSSFSTGLPVESRILLAAIQVTTTGNSVSVVGTTAAESVRLSPVSGGYLVSSTDPAIQFSLNANPAQSSVVVPISQIGTLTVKLGEGSDTLLLQGVQATQVNLEDVSVAADTNLVTIAGGTLGTVSARFENGTAKLILDAQAGTLQITGDVTANFVSTVSSELLLTTTAVTGRINQSGRLTATSTGTSSDKVTMDALSGQISLGGLWTDLGAGNDTLTISPNATILGESDWKMGAGSDTILAQKLNAQGIKIDDTGVAGDVNTVTFEEGVLTALTATFNQGTSKLTLDAKASLMRVTEDVTVTSNSTQPTEVLYTTSAATGMIDQAGKLTVKSTGTSADKVTLDAKAGKISLNSLMTELGAGNDTLAISPNATILGESDWKMGAGNDTILAQKLEAQGIKIDDTGVAGDVNTVTFEEGVLTALTATFTQGSSKLTLDAKASLMRVTEDVTVTSNSTQPTEVLYTTSASTGMIDQIGKLKVTSNGSSASTSNDKVTLDPKAGTISLVSLNVNLGIGNDLLLIQPKTNIVDNDWTMGAGSDTIFARQTNLQKVIVNDVGAAGDVNTVTFEEGVLTELTTTFNQGSSKLTLDAKASVMRVIGDVSVTSNSTLPTEVLYTTSAATGMIDQAGKLSVKSTGTSADKVILDAKTGKISLNSLMTELGAGNDTLTILPNVTILGTSDWKMGTGSDTILTENLNAHAIVIDDSGAVSDINSVTLEEGSLRSLDATFGQGTSRLMLDAKTTAVTVNEDVSVKFTNSAAGEVIYNGSVSQTGQLSVTSVGASNDKVTLDAKTGAIQLGNLKTSLGAGNDALTIRPNTTILGASEWKMGTGNNTILAQNLNAQAIQIDESDITNSPQDLNAVTFEGGNLTDIVAIFGSGAARLTFDAKSSQLNIGGDVTFTYKGNLLGEVQYLGGEPTGGKIVQGGLLKTDAGNKSTSIRLDAQKGKIELTGFDLRLGASADTIRVRNDVSFSQPVVWDLGDGNNVVEVVSDKPTIVPFALELKMGGGADRVLLTGVQTTSLQINSGAGTDLVQVQGGQFESILLDSAGEVTQELTGTTDRRLVVTGSVHANSASSSSKSTLLIKDYVTIAGNVNLKSLGAMSADKLILEGLLTPLIIGSVSAELREGADQIVGRGAVVVNQPCKWDLGAGNDLIDIQNTAKLFVLPALEVVLGAGSDRVFFKGLSARTLKLSDGVTASDSDTKSIAIEGGEFGVVTGIFDMASIAMEITSANVTGDVQLTLKKNRSSRFSVVGGTIQGRLLYDSRGSDTVANDSIDLVRLNGGSSHLAIGALTLYTGASDDSIQVDGHVTIEGVVRIAGGSGHDALSVVGATNSDRVTFKQSLDVNLGDGNDTVNLERAALLAITTLELGSGSDRLALTDSEFQGETSLLLGSGANSAVLDSSRFYGLVSITATKGSKTTVTGNGGMIFAQDVSIKLWEGSVTFSGSTALGSRLFLKSLRVQGGVSKTRIPVNLGSNKAGRLVLVKAELVK